MGPEHIRVVQDYGFYGSNFWLAGAVTSYYAVTIKSVSWSQVSTTHVVHPVYPGHHADHIHHMAIRDQRFCISPEALERELSL